MTILDVSEHIHMAVQQLEKWIRNHALLLTGHNKNCLGEMISIEGFITSVHQGEHNEDATNLLGCLL